MDNEKLRAEARASIRPRRSFGYELARVFFAGFHRLSGWSVEEGMPPDLKTVVLAAPHNTNWDLMRMLGVAFYYRIPVRWMGKKSLGEGPFGWMMRWWGLLPVDRSQSTSLVDQVVEAFNTSDELIVVIAAEGTRSKVKQWKTGFYNIAYKAGVPISLGFMDYDRKVGGVGGPFMPTGNFAADMEEILAFYHAHVVNFDPPSIQMPRDD
ncbi:MAG: lysophospholipid acyltransferase family protein [Henriciella sp.]|nr:lysophospholipid acyltransferase family protein [Henriciella sp.]